MGYIQICGAPVGSTAWNVGEGLINLGNTQPVGGVGSAELLIGNALVNGFNGDAAALEGSLASILTAPLSGPLSALAGAAVAIIGGVMTGADPSNCPTNSPSNSQPVPMTMTELNNLFYNTFGMTPSQAAAANGSSAGADSYSSVVIVGGVPQEIRQ